MLLHLVLSFLFKTIIYLRTQSKYKTGIIGENIIKHYLESIGLQVLNSRYKTPFGEIDLIAYDANINQIIFIEVKSTSGKYIDYLNVLSDKQKNRIIEASQCFFAENNNYLNSSSRFDICFVKQNVIDVHLKNITIWFERLIVHRNIIAKKLKL